MELLIGIACVFATLYYLYLIIGFADIRREKKRRRKR